MKKIAILFMTIFCCAVLHAQSGKNSIEIGKSFYHFSNTKWDGNFELNLAYSRKLNNDHVGMRMGATFFNKEYVYNESCYDIGNVFDRYFFLFEASAFFDFFSNERSVGTLHFGPIYRQGSENQVVEIIERDNWTDIVTYEFSNSGLGLLLASSYQFKFSPTWGIRAEMGLHQIFQKDGTPFDFYGGLKIGYSF